MIRNAARGAVRYCLRIQRTPDAAGLRTAWTVRVQARADSPEPNEKNRFYTKTLPKAWITYSPNPSQKSGGCPNSDSLQWSSHQKINFRASCMTRGAQAELTSPFPMLLAPLQGDPGAVAPLQEALMP